MTPEFIQYLDTIKGRAKLDRQDENEVINELESHIEDKVEELKETGISEEEAVRICLGEMGSTEMVARQIYEAYSQGSWKQVFLASMPHLLFGGLFVLNWWHHLTWLAVLLVLTLGITVYGWWHGKPTWVFSWLGYTLIPVLAVGIMLLYLPRGWSLLTIPVYLPLTLWWLLRVIIQTTRKDWLFATVMLLPFPILFGWFIAISPGWRFTEDSFQRLNLFAPWIGLSFMALALTIAVFIRVRQRWVRIVLLGASGLLTLTMVAYYSMGRLNTFTFVGLVFVMWGVLLVPPLLERQLKGEHILFHRKKVVPLAGSE